MNALHSAVNRPAFIWRSPALRLLLAAVPVWCIGSLLLASTSWRLTALIGAIVAVTLAAPAYGLLTVALLTPFGALLVKVMGMPLRLTEAMVVAFLAAWLLRPVGRTSTGSGPTVPPVMTHAAWLLGLAALCSVAITASQLGHVEMTYTKRVLRYFYFQEADWIGAGAAMRLVEGLGLAAATICIFRQRPSLAVSLPAVLGTSAAVCALGAVWIWAYDLVRVLGLYCCRGVRVHVQTTDPNAAGSYFALILCLMLGMTAWARGFRARAMWGLAALACAIGLWFTLSRTAAAAAVFAVIGGVGWYAGGRLRSTARTVLVCAMFAIVIAVMAYRVHRQSFGVDFRRQFYETSWRMIQARPFFGVGIGQYYPASALFFPPRLAFTYGFENAHNNFLQVGAELGFVGLALLSAWLVAGLTVAARAIARARDPRLFGAAVGALAFAGTWLASHPLLVEEVAFPFWMLAGLMTALAGSTLLNTESLKSEVRSLTSISSAPENDSKLQTSDFRLSSFRLSAAGIVLICAAIGYAQGPLGLQDSRDVDGVYEWQTAPDGTRFRWTQQFASVFVPANAVMASIPLRLPRAQGLAHPFHVDVAVQGVLRERTDLTETWSVLAVPLPPVAPPIRYKRIDLRAEHAWQPALYIPENAEMRPVGVQLGEITTVRGR